MASSTPSDSLRVPVHRGTALSYETSMTNSDDSDGPRTSVEGIT